MKWVITAGILAAAGFAGPAMASCVDFGGVMADSDITTLLNPGGSIYACYNPGSGRENNETLVNATQVQDFKNGAPGPGNNDPTAIVGTYTIGGGATGVIAYTYSSGGTFSYNICKTPAGSIYQFVNTSTNANLSIAISTGPGSC